MTDMTDMTDIQRFTTREHPPANTLAMRQGQYLDVSCTHVGDVGHVGHPHISAHRCSMSRMSPNRQTPLLPAWVSRRLRFAG